MLLHWILGRIRRELLKLTALVIQLQIRDRLWYKPFHEEVHEDMHFQLM